MTAQNTPRHSRPATASVRRDSPTCSTTLGRPGHGQRTRDRVSGGDEPLRRCRELGVHAMFLVGLTTIVRHSLSRLPTTFSRFFISPRLSATCLAAKPRPE